MPRAPALLASCERALLASGLPAPEAAASCRLLLEHARAQPQPPPLAEAFAGLVRRRAAREPLQYILGEWDFSVLRAIAVRPPTLVPRPETEELVALALRHCSAAARRGPGVRLLEVGAGSGAVSVALLAQLPEASAAALELAPSAAALCRENASRFGVADRLSVYCCDALAWSRGAGAEPPFDVLVSNPPYLPEALVRLAEPEVRDWEDPAALCGGEPDGSGFLLAMLRRAAAAPAWLVPGGRVFLETHTSHPAMLAAVLAPALRGTTLHLAPASELGRGIDVEVGAGGDVDEGAAAELRRAFSFRAAYCDCFGRPRFVELGVR